MAKSAKSSLALTREQFRSQAKALPVTINGKEMTALAKEFSTGSLGWNINDKLAVEVGGQTVMVQVGLNLTIIGSKDIPPDGGGPIASAPPMKAPAADTDAPAAEPDAPPDAAGQASF